MPMKPEQTLRLKVSVQMVTVQYREAYSVGTDVKVVEDIPNLATSQR